MDNQILLEKIEKQTRQQALFTKILCVFCAVILICMLVLTFFVVNAAGQITELAEQAKFVMDNLDVVTWELGDYHFGGVLVANADIGGMIENMGALTTDSQAIVEEAMSKLNAINLDALNQAIEDLANIVEPLANFTKFFG